MSDPLPSGWTLQPLRQVSERLIDGSHNPPPRQAAGLPMLSAQNIRHGALSFADARLITEADFEREARRTRVRPDDVLLSIVGSIGRSAVVRRGTPPFTLQRSVAVISPRGVDPRFLQFQLASPNTQRFFDENARGTAQKGVYLGALGEMPVRVAPLREQQRIVSRIEELFSEIDEGERALQRVGQLVERYRQSVLKAAVTGELTRGWRAAHASDASAAMIGVEDLPAGWKRSSLEALSAKVTSGSRDWKSFYGRGDGVFIMAQNVRPGRLDLSELQLVDPPVGSKDAERSQVAEGDLLITIVGAKTGDICRVDRPLQKHYVCQSVALVRLADPQLSPYVELFLLADEGGQAQFAETIYGAGRPHLSFDQIKAVSVPLPPPEEQAAILDAVRRAESELQATIKVVAASRQQADALRQSILKAAFTGQLVPQDPHDEPASALLARLAAQAAEAPAAPRRRGAPRKNALA